METITKEQLLSTHKTVETARESDSPFVVRQNDGIAVIGDPNKTEKKESSYVVTFRFVKGELEEIPTNAKVIDKYIIVNQKFDNITLNPRSDIILMRALQKLVGVFTEMDNILENRAESVTKLDAMANSIDKEEYQNRLDKINEEYAEKVLDMYAYAGETAQNSMYDFVSKLLRLDDFMTDHLLATSVVSVFNGFILDNPNLWNEAESVFGL